MDDSIGTTSARSGTAEGAAPPQAPPAAGPSAGTPGPRRKRRGCLVALAVTVALIILTVIGVAVVLGQMSQPEELGVTYTEADFDSALAKAGVTWPELPEGADPDDYERVYEGQKPLDATFSEAELSALMSYRHGSSYWPIKSMQIDLGAGGAQASAVVAYSGRDWPVTVSGSGGISGKTLDVSIASATVSGIEVPAEYLPLGAEFLEEIVNARLARIPGFGIDSLEITDEGVHVTGTIWETATYVEAP